MKTILSIAPVVTLASLLAGCGKSEVCSDPDVLATVKQLFEEQEFGKFYKMPPGIVLVRDKSATHLSTDPNNQIARCSVIITIDLFEMLKKVQGYSDEQIAAVRVKAQSTGQNAAPDSLINYSVQSMASGEYYVMMLP
ncbi:MULTISPECIES: hypothetical protein [unclassified Bradyrhizobium]|uniref:hypothetical protein n=1 Tax=unclassified Bradyrhizobium TaxID=2631580 RepID=UPI001CD240B0|nr:MULTISPECIES: hypothetical protein [unclassified Bradyrhizobium]MCA1398404.1 hypothetical protein [Bradyrhizobium sp. BRP56]UWU92667.1 hypothetical protein N2604_01460 [Bradyrhizobium sp. CB1015]